jgi:hypothetical protein
MRDPGAMIGAIAVMGIFGIPIIAVIGHYCHLSLKSWLEVSLKRDMVNRGYSADEIIAVIAAEPGKVSKSFLPNVPPAKPMKQPAFGP